MPDVKAPVAEVTQLNKTLDKIHTAIAKHNNDEAVAALKKLETDDVPSREALAETKAGAAINKLSKKSLPAVSVAAAAVLAKWKSAHASKTKRKREDGGDEDVKGEGASPRASGSGEKKVKLEAGKAVKKEALIKGETNGASSSRSSPVPSQPRKPRSTIIKNDPPRTTVLDKPNSEWLEPAFTDAEDEKGMNLRKRGVVLFYDALAYDNREEKQVISNIARQLEQAVFESAGKTTGDAYRSKNRQLYMSIKEATNDVLRDRIVRGDHSAHDVVNLSEDELKSRAVAAEEEAIDKQNMFEARGAGATEAETDAFKCGKCGQRKTTYYQMQTRSADEPMTTFVTCVACNNRWKFC